MKKFLLHFEHHKPKTVLAFRFSRKDAEQYLRAVGADADMLERTFAILKRTSVASLAIV